MDQPGVFMFMVKHTGLALGVSETLVVNWGNQGRLPSVRLEQVKTTFFPVSYITSVRENAIACGVLVNATQVDAFNATPHAHAIAEQSRQAFDMLLASRSELSALELQELFGVNEMVLARWVSMGYVPHVNDPMSTAVFASLCEWRGLYRS